MDCASHARIETAATKRKGLQWGTQKWGRSKKSNDVFGDIPREFTEPHARAWSASERASDRNAGQSPDGPAVEIRAAVAGFRPPRLRLKAFRIPTIARYPAPIPNAIESMIMKSSARGTNRVVKSLYLLL